MHELYKNNKTGKLYLALGKAINATNEADGQEMISYIDLGITRHSFVREKDEFFEKFTRVDPTSLVV